MPVLYNSTPLIPAPLITVSRQIQTAPDGTNLGSLFQLTLKGTLVTVPPGTSFVETPGRLGVLLTKQKFLSDLFSVDGKIFEVYSPDGTGVTKCNPVVKSVDFYEGIWVDKTEYAIVLEAPNFYSDLPDDSDDNTGFVYDISDEWSIEEAGITTDLPTEGIKPVWKLTHNVSAKGRLVYNELGIIEPDEVAWKQARDWVIKRLETSNFDTRPFDTKNEINLVAGGQGYNHVRLENVDIVQGSFSISETWILAYGIPATEDYTVQVRYTPEEAVNTSVSVAGTIRGMNSGLNQADGKIQNAINYFNVSVKDKLIVRARAAVVGITISDYGTTGNLDYNYAEGSIGYSYEFSDKPAAEGDDTVYDVYTVSKKVSIDTVETVVTIQGTVTGRLRPGEPNSSLLKFERAKAYWDVISTDGTLLNRAKRSGVGGLKAAPLNSSADYNFYEGFISYSYDFDNRINSLARNEYTTSIKSNRSDGTTTVNIDGSITGLRASELDPPTAKYDNALAFFLTWEPEVFVKASTFAPAISLNPEPSSRSRGDNVYTGNISYSFEYNTDSVPTLENALSEQLTISDTNPADVYASIPVLGRKAGPILQDIGSKREKSRSVSLDAFMKYGFSKPTTSEVDAVINIYKPSAKKIFVERDEENWQPNNFHFTRNVTWVYET